MSEALPPPPPFDPSGATPPASPSAPPAGAGADPPAPPPPPPAPSLQPSEPGEPLGPRAPRGPRRSVVGLLMLVMLLAAFALGGGVLRIVDPPDDGSAFLRSTRGGVAVAAAAGDDQTSPVAAAAPVAARDSRFAILDEVYDVLDRDFVEPETFESTDLRRAAINGIIDALGDPHMAYIDAETYRLSSEDIGGSFEGIGCTVNDFDGEITIVTVFSGSPAQAAGVRNGDVLLEVDGESIDDWSLQEAVQRIRGPSGTVVELLVRHTDQTEELLPITRDRIVVPSVRSLPITDRDGNPVADIGFIWISQFTEDTRPEIVSLLEAAQTAGLSKIIIDLRNNPGGLLRATVETTGEFVDQEVILREIHRDGEEQIFRDEPGGQGLEMEVVILLNGASASGSEVMAAALRDHGRAVLIGQVTSGKGTVNVPRKLSDGSVLYVSTARWISPNGTLIEGIGVIPDIEVAQPETGFEAGIDVQLMTAIDYLRGDWQPPGATSDDESDGQSDESAEDGESDATPDADDSESTTPEDQQSEE